MTVPDLAPMAENETPRPEEPVWPKVIKWAVTLGILIPFIWSVAGLQISMDRVWQAPGQVLTLVTGMFPPDFSGGTELMGKLL